MLLSIASFRLVSELYPEPARFRTGTGQRRQLDFGLAAGGRPPAAHAKLCGQPVECVGIGLVGHVGLAVHEGDAW